MMEKAEVREASSELVQAANLPRHLGHAQLQWPGVGGEPAAAAFVGAWRACCCSLRGSMESFVGRNLAVEEELIC